MRYILTVDFEDDIDIESFMHFVAYHTKRCTRSASATSTTTTGGSTPKTTAASKTSTRNTRTKATPTGAPIYRRSSQTKTEHGLDTD